MNYKDYYNNVAKQRNKREPWKRLLKSINYRCYNPNSEDYIWYRSKKIENYLTIDDIKYLMERDNYYKLKNPTIDRKNNDGNYELNNCRFIENTENAAKDKRKPVLQYDLAGNFIKEWISQAEAGRKLGISQGNIAGCCSGKRLQASGYKWKFKVDNQL